MSGPLVDTPTVGEFMSEILQRVSEAELAAIAGDLERKSAFMAEALADPERLDAGGWQRVLRNVFTARRRAGRILDAVGPAEFGAATAHLLETADIDAFPESYELAGELLHFGRPGRWWLWTRWMWDPGTETGSLALVTEDADLSGATNNETYVKVGQAVAFVDETGKAAGFTAFGPATFGVDVFLACVYAVYMYTVLRMRMTSEFNAVVPDLPELVRRLLGVHRLEV